MNTDSVLRQMMDAQSASLRHLATVRTVRKRAGCFVVVTTLAGIGCLGVTVATVVCVVLACLKLFGVI